MKSLIALFALMLSLSASGCTVYHGGVKNVTPLKDGSLSVDKCDLKIYLAFYGVIAEEANCTTEIASIK